MNEIEVTKKRLYLKRPHERRRANIYESHVYSDKCGVLRSFFNTLINHAQQIDSNIETIHQCECGNGVLKCPKIS